TKINIAPSSSVYLSDGLGTKVRIVLGQADLVLKNPSSDGIIITSQTHPFSDDWYNNNNPIFSWENEAEGYAVLVDSNPKTFPPNIITTDNNTISYSDLLDGIWYFHIKSKGKEGWSSTSHYQFKIDTTPPESFKPEINTIDNNGQGAYVITFNTDDILSGLDHYEVGILKQNVDKNVLPVFVETPSPYIVPFGEDVSKLQFVVKAFDNAGNVRESYVGQRLDYSIFYIPIALAIMLLLFILHYLFGHHILIRLKKAYEFFQKTSDTTRN
ncbi:MAG: hypothetical protein M3P22_01755, partial [bacterium]|nr:hypothetical protein [bacterium]